jgi:hypothetical protein
LHVQLQRARLRAGFLLHGALPVFPVKRLHPSAAERRASPLLPGVACDRAAPGQGVPAPAPPLRGQHRRPAGEPGRHYLVVAIVTGAEPAGRGLAPLPLHKPLRTDPAGWR